MALSEYDLSALEDRRTGQRVRLSGKRALFEQLLADGVDSVFGNPGTTEQGFMDLLPDYPSISYYLALHEGVAVGMADAYARAARKPTLVELHITPGLGNAIGMLYNAHVAHSPLVVYVGQSPTDTLFREPYLSGDLVAMARPVSKWATEITHAADVPQALRRAFKVAQEPPQGPVVLSLPMDVLDDEAEMVIRPTSFVNWRSRPPQGAVEEAADMLLSARSPAFAIGNHLGLAEGQGALIALAELLGAPVHSTFTNEVNAPIAHPLYHPKGIMLTPATLRRALEPHDLLLLVGGPLNPSLFPDSGDLIPEGTRLIHVDYDSWELGKNHPEGLLVKADPKEMLLALTEELLQRADLALRRQWQERRASHERATLARREILLREHARHWDAVPISPHRLAAEVVAALPENAALFDEAGSNGPSLDSYLKPSEPGSWFRTRGGGIGGGIPGALGLQVAFPGRPVVGFISDGASLFTITALWTAAHHRLPATYVVANNRSYRRLKQNLLEYRRPEALGRPFVHMDLTDPELRFDRIAESFGVRARRVERPEDLAPALRESIAADEPRLVEVVVDGGV